MKNLKIAGGFLNQIPFDWSGNEKRIRAIFDIARSENVGVLVLPELCITGYGCEDAFFNPHLLETAWQVLERLVPETCGFVTTLGLPVLHRGVIFNVIALVGDGKILGLIPKKVLASEGIHYEPRWFKSWEVGAQDQLHRGSESIPFGDFYFDINGVRVGLEICEEAWVSNRPGVKLAQENVDLILNPSASHFAFGKIDIRKGFVSEGSRAFGVAYVYSNLMGNEAGRVIYDGGVLIAAHGKLLAQGPRFSYADYGLTSAVIDLDLLRVHRSRRSCFNELDCILSQMNWQFLPPSKLIPQLPSETYWENGVYRKEEEFARAVSLGLFDFLRKSRLHGFVVSLSGGIDSAVVSLLVAQSIRFAVQELGVSGVQEKLNFIPEIKTLNTESQIIHRLLVCAYQATRNSSQETFDAALYVANAIGASFLHWSVDSIVEEYSTIVSKASGIILNWEDHDLALQNIQARSRSPSIWLLANLRNALLLATSNRSEAAVGYATMDGDTSGGLSPIAGIDKAYLKKWICWAEKIGPEGLSPVPALEWITKRPPTAELRPENRCQTDEQDLMPYEILDLIERFAIRDKRSPLEIFDWVTAEMPEVSKSQLLKWIKRFFELWSRNQWKRERFAPSFHLDDESLDPKTWYRFPILSGGFSKELEDLERERGTGGEYR